MDNSVITTIISTSGAVIVGLGGMWISTNQVGKRIDDVIHRIDRLEDKFEAFRQEFAAFKEVINGKFRDLDTEIGKLLDRGPHG